MPCQNCGTPIVKDHRGCCSERCRVEYLIRRRDEILARRRATSAVAPVGPPGRVPKEKAARRKYTFHGPYYQALKGPDRTPCGHCHKTEKAAKTCLGRDGGTVERVEP